MLILRAIKKSNKIIALLLFSLNSHLFGQLTPTWKPFDMFGGGKVTGIFFHQSNANEMYCRTDVAGIYKSVDAGINWTYLLNNIPKDSPHNFKVRGFGIAPSNASIMYFASGKDPLNSSSSFWKSTNAGSTWSRTNCPTKFAGNGDYRWAGEVICIDPTNENKLFVAGQPTFSAGAWNNDGGLYVSSNGGTSWLNLKSTTLNQAWITGIKFQPNNANFLFVSAAITSQSSVNTTIKGLWKYDIANDILTQIFTEEVVDFDFDANYAINQTVILCNTQGYAKSSNNGSTWTAVIKPYSTDDYRYFITCHPTESGHWFAGAVANYFDNGFVETVNFGANWAKTTYGTTNTVNKNKVSFPAYAQYNVQPFLGAETIGLYFSPLLNGVAFTNNIYKSVNATGSLIDMANSNILSNARWDWTYQVNGIYIMVVTRGTNRPQDASRLFVNCADVSGYNSFDGGNTTRYNGVNSTNYGACVRFSSYNPNKAYLVGGDNLRRGKISLSIDNGTSWTNLAGSYFNNVLLLDAQISTADDQTVIVGVEPKTIGAATNPVYRTTDGGTTWSIWDTNLPTGIFKEWEGVDRLLKDADGQTLFIWTPTSIFKRNFTGNTQWNAITLPPGVTSISHFTAHPTKANTIYLSNNTGNIYQSNDEGSTWAAINVSAYSTKISTFSVNQYGGILMKQNESFTALRPQVLWYKADDSNVSTWQTVSTNGYFGTIDNFIFTDNQKILSWSDGHGAFTTNLALPCPSTITFTNATYNFISGNVAPKQASQNITATNIIFPAINVSYQAGNSIQLLPGFKADIGSIFVAQIDGCR